MIDGTLNLRSGPSYSASIVTVMPGNSRVTVTGGSQSGFYPVTFGSTSGWALGTYLDIDAGEDPGSDDDDRLPPTGETATVIDGALNLRSAPAPAARAGGHARRRHRHLTGQSSNGFLSVSYRERRLGLRDLPEHRRRHPAQQRRDRHRDRRLAQPAGQRQHLGRRRDRHAGWRDGHAQRVTSNGFSRVTWNGNTGWAYSIYLSTGGDDGGSGNGTFATVFDGALNLRSGAGTGFGVVRVLPDGARVELTGSTSNGFTPGDLPGNHRLGVQPVAHDRRLVRFDRDRHRRRAQPARQRLHQRRGA